MEFVDFSKMDVFIAATADALNLADTCAVDRDIYIALKKSDEQPPSEIAFNLTVPGIPEVTENRGIIISEEAERVIVKVTAVDTRFADALMQIFSGSQPMQQPSSIILATVKQTDGNYAVLVHSPAGILTAKQLAKIAEISAKGPGIVKMTHAQRMAILISSAQLSTVESDLSEVGLRIGVLHKGVRNIRACTGTLCKWCNDVDVIGNTLALDKELLGTELQYDVKIAFSGCMRNCSESYCSDIGFIGVNGKYRMLIGGKGSGHPVVAQTVYDALEPANVIDATKYVLEVYQRVGQEKERLHKTIDRVGINIFQKTWEC